MKISPCPVVAVSLSLILAACGSTETGVGPANPTGAVDEAKEREFEARLARLESTVEAMQKDLANWKRPEGSFERGAQGGFENRPGASGMARGTRFSDPAGGGLIHQATEAAVDFVANDAAEALGKMVGEAEAGTPATLKPRPEPTNEATSGQQGHAGQR